VYDGGIRVPGIVRWPGHVPAGKTSDQPIIGSDFFTTLCTITKAPIPNDRPIDGVNIVPAFEGKPVVRKTPMYWRYHDAPEPMKIAMREGDWTILSNVELTKFEIYNMKTDPQQKTELSAKEPARLQQLQATLRRLNAEIENEGPDWWRGYEEPKPKKKTP
ncbi:MAG: hypothetical protein L0215_20500, partial [Gemmataceae bacterium]|nr:hypothetical protein [Gemmataceae bacterium]